MKKVNWWIVGIVAVLASLFLFSGGMVYGGWGYRGPGMMGWGYFPFGWFGMGLGMIFMWLIPTGIIAILIYGAVALTRSSANNAPTASIAACPNCGKGTQADWKNCPYCGTALE
jgi:uncharacterized membrane protein